MAERTVSWKPKNENKLFGTRVERLDGVAKASGRAKYTADINTEGTLFARVLTSPHAYAKIKSLDVEAARKVPGVKSIHLLKEVDDELLWDGMLIAIVAAERPELAEDGIRAIKVEYEALEHFVDEDDLEGATAAEKIKKQKGRSKGEVDQVFENADIVHSGYYGIHSISHMCMEPHGAHCEWKDNKTLDVHLSTQNVSGTAGQFAGPLGLDAAKVTINCEYIGGGFGSKFAADEWGLAAARIAQETGRPVRIMLDRGTELKTAGVRPSGFHNVSIAAKKDGEIIAWDTNLWGASDIDGKPISPNTVPYVFSFDTYRRETTGIIINGGPDRAWRAPNHPQACALTQTAMDDLAAKLDMDPYELFMRNLDKTHKAEVYAEQMKIGADLIDWKANWKKRGTNKESGSWRRGLGLALHMWGGRAHNGTCLVKIHSDGTVESFAGSQDIGTGTRTAIGITLAETFGIPLSKVKVHIGSSQYPKSGPSGGSTTIGGVSGPHRRAALDGLWKIFDLVAAKYNVDSESLSASEGKIISEGKAICSWQEAARLIGPMPLEVQGEGPKKDGLTDKDVGGVQLADVSVDIETGEFRINKFVAVQDCGTIINHMAAESQVYGGMIMGIAYAFTEERILDNKTGRFINADLLNYKLPRIGDIGELVVHMHEPDSEYKRGVIGLGEPPVISCGAALSNAVANAIGTRVPVLPMTPNRILDALDQQKLSQKQQEGGKS